MEKNELKTQVAALVDDLFNEKEETEIRKQTQVELEKAASAISDLTSALEDKNAEFSGMEEKLTASDAVNKELESELEAAKKELEQANEKLGVTEQALEDIKKDRLAETRMAEIEDAGVARSDKKDQIVKVKEMSNEDFASYKDELVSIRKAILAELKVSKAEADAQAKVEAEAKVADEAVKKAKETNTETDGASEETVLGSEVTGETASEETGETASGDETITTPAKITPGQAAMASLNMEYIPSQDIMSKYAKLGEAMAKRFKKSDE